MARACFQLAAVALLLRAVAAPAGGGGACGLARCLCVPAAAPPPQPPGAAACPAHTLQHAAAGRTCAAAPRPGASASLLLAITLDGWPEGQHAPRACVLHACVARSADAGACRPRQLLQPDGSSLDASSHAAGGALILDAGELLHALPPPPAAAAAAASANASSAGSAAMAGQGAPVLHLAAACAAPAQGTAPEQQPKLASRSVVWSEPVALLGLLQRQQQHVACPPDAATLQVWSWAQADADAAAGAASAAAAARHGQPEPQRLVLVALELPAAPAAAHAPGTAAAAQVDAAGSSGQTGEPEAALAAAAGPAPASPPGPAGAAEPAPAALPTPAPGVSAAQLWAGRLGLASVLVALQLPLLATTRKQRGG